MSPVRVSIILLLAVSLPAGADRLVTEALPSLPEAVSNNAVALLETGSGVSLVSVMGLGAGKRHTDIHARAWVLDAGHGHWREGPLLPVPEGRLAGVAAVAGGTVWLFGGYTVAADGTEASTPEVHRWHPGTDAWVPATDMPVPVDDTLALVHQDRYIYLVSGWHDLGNVNLVQVLDTRELQWHQATPYPGQPVFGHAGGMAGRRMAICGGVRIAHRRAPQARAFLPSAECWLGEVDAGDFRHIAWHPLEPHPGPPRYRAAAVADDRGRVVFAGGSDNPYNFDGIGYDGRPSGPLAPVLSLDLGTLDWRVHGAFGEPSMDHRGLLHSGGWYYLAGGMLAAQQVTARVLRFRLDD